jgi:CRISPR-associated exonuclease Cas4
MRDVVGATMNWELLALALLVIGALAWALSRQMRAATGLPGGRVISADTSRWLPTDRPLFSRQYQLTGKPDYLVRERGNVIPVEVKSSRAPGDSPREGHILQLAAYCLLVTETEGRRPSHGLIKYADAVFEVNYTPALERAVLDTLNAMRRDLSGGRARRNHAEPARCVNCGYRHACDERLV